MKTTISASLLAATAASLFATSAMAQSADGLVLEAGYAEAFDVQGAELGAGWRFNAGPLSLTPTVGGFIYQSDNDRYQFDSNVDRCRDRTNGQFARDIQCNDATVAPFGRIEATARFRRIEAGIGYRVAEEQSVAYGTVSIQAGQGWAVKANAGKDYLGLGVVLRR